jgi:hypothetical protein
MRICSILTPVIISFLGLTAIASAQAAPPPGPYNETCQAIEMKGSTLHARCQTADGKWADAKLEKANQCSDGVINLNGILSCQTGLLPPGSYVESCANVRVEGATLKADCRNNKDRLVATELKNANRCTGDIANKDGSLRCIAAPKQATPEQPEKKEKKKKKRFVVF